MKFLATRGTIWFCIFSLVSCESLPDPIIQVTPLPSNESTATKFVFVEQRTVTVTCSFPITAWVDLELAYNIAVFNPILGSDHGLVQVEAPHKTQLNVKYPSNILIPLINVTCTAKNWTNIGNETELSVLSSSTMQIEQLYRTTVVDIEGYKNQTMVEPGDHLELKCLTDGNPLPQQYQWHNRTKDGDVALDNETGQTLKFTAPPSWSSQSIIVCGAKNKFNNGSVKSGNVTVTSVYISPPAFRSLPRPTIMATSEKLVFKEVTQITMECYIPMKPVPHDIYERFAFGSYEKNPAHPKELPVYSIYAHLPKMVIKYHPTSFIPVLNISCVATNITTGKVKKTSNILIEQHYKTMTVVNVGLNKLMVNTGDTVRLECLADGNPEPRYQWFNRTEEGYDIRLINETRRILEFLTPTHWPTTSLYTCSAENEYNTHIIKGKAVSVTSVHIPTPEFEFTPSPTIISTSERVEFIEEPNVTVKCSLPRNPIPQDIDVKIVLDNFDQNPVYPDEAARVTTQEDKPQLDFAFNPERFLPLLNVSCHAVYRHTGHTMKTSTILIEQQYKTMNVINDAVDEKTVEAGATVRLICKADGNPKPEYQWYNKSEDSHDTILKNETQRILEFVTPTNWSTTGVYTCGAKNEYNIYFVKAKPVSVTSIYVPPPRILLFPSTTYNSTTDRFVFREEPNVTATCSLPMADIPEYMKLTMEVRQAEPNPVYPDKEAKITVIKGQEVVLKISYAPNTYAPLVEVACQALNIKKHKKETVTIQIEQKYRTKNTLVFGPPSVSASIGRTVTLRCLADGKPSPEYQWFNETRDGFVALANATRPTLELTATPDTPSVGVYMCGARNEFNFEIMMSNSIEVTITQSRIAWRSNSKKH